VGATGIGSTAVGAAVGAGDRAGVGGEVIVSNVYGKKDPKIKRTASGVEGNNVNECGVSFKSFRGIGYII